jgi:hypothetical protein
MDRVTIQAPHPSALSFFFFFFFISNLGWVTGPGWPEPGKPYPNIYIVSFLQELPPSPCYCTRAVATPPDTTVTGIVANQHRRPYLSVGFGCQIWPGCALRPGQIWQCPAQPHNGRIWPYAGLVWPRAAVMSGPGCAAAAWVGHARRPGRAPQPWLAARLSVLACRRAAANLAVQCAAAILRRCRWPIGACGRYSRPLWLSTSGTASMRGGTTTLPLPLQNLNGRCLFLKLKKKYTETINLALIPLLEI